MGSSHQGLSNDMAEHRPILKNNQNTYYLRFSFSPKTDIAFPKTGISFYSGGVKRNHMLNVRVTWYNLEYLRRFTVKK